MERLWISLPGFLLSAVSAVPLSVGILSAVRFRRDGARVGYLSSLYSAIAAGAVTLMMLWGPLFSGTGWADSSTAALVFVFVPFYAAIAQGIVFGVSRALLSKFAERNAISPVDRRAILIPASMLAVLTVGYVKTAIDVSPLTAAERAWDPETLQGLFDKSQTGAVDSFGVPLFLAQNPNTTPALLVELTKHEHPAVRVHAVQHPRTPIDVVIGLREDPSQVVREAVERRLKDQPDLTVDSVG